MCKIAIEKPKKSIHIWNVMKLFTSPKCIFIEASVNFRKILNKFWFILIFRPKRVKSQLKQYFSATKAETLNCLWCQR